MSKHIIPQEGRIPNTPWKGPRPGEMATAFIEAFVAPEPEKSGACFDFLESPIPITAFTRDKQRIADFLARKKPLPRDRIRKFLANNNGHRVSDAEIDEFVDLLGEAV